MKIASASKSLDGIPKSGKENAENGNITKENKRRAASINCKTQKAYKNKDVQVKLPVTQMAKGQMPSDYQNPGNAQPYS